MKRFSVRLHLTIVNTCHLIATMDKTLYTKEFAATVTSVIPSTWQEDMTQLTSQLINCRDPKTMLQLHATRKKLLQDYRSQFHDYLEQHYPELLI